MWITRNIINYTIYYLDIGVSQETNSLDSLQPEIIELDLSFVL